MKKLITFFVLFWLVVLITWCNKHNILWDQILDYDKRVGAARMYCEKSWWIVKYWDDEHEHICFYDDDSYCYLRDLYDEKCGKWEFYDFDNQWWGEWITAVTDMCNEEWWEIQEWSEWWEIQNVCYFPDESFCYLEDLAADMCHKWDMKYYDDSLYVYAEQACFDNNWQISQTEDWEDICVLNDEEFCYMSDVMDWACDLLYQDMLDIQEMHEGERMYQEYIAECYEQEQITVCGKDWISYYNRCFMEKAWVEEETEVKIVDWECVFG